MKKKLLLVTRKYPPIKGGMEQYSYDLYTNLSKKMDVTLLANTKGNKFILPFYIKTFFYLLFNSRKFTNVHFTDGAMSLFIPYLKLISKAKVTITINGLDIVLKNKLYQFFVPKFVDMADNVVCISKATMEECVKRGISKQKCVLISIGINIDELKDTNVKRRDIEKKFKFSTANKQILFTLGRLVKRKGQEWFISNIAHKLDNKFIYAVAGDGPDKERILQSIIKYNLQDKVIMLGKISDEEKIWFFKNSKYFIMPNIHIEGDMEGFGIVAIEAAAYGLPVIASNIEGIRDAVIGGKTGYLIDINSNFVNNYMNLIDKDFKIDPTSLKVLTWDNIIDKFLMVLK